MARKFQGLGLGDVKLLAAWVTASPARTPTLTMFGNDNYFFETGANTGCTPVAVVCEGPGFAWNHGDLKKQITQTLVAMAGPGVQHLDRNDELFTDHADVRPTNMALVGLKDDYVHEGRVITESIQEQALPEGIRQASDNFTELAAISTRRSASSVARAWSGRTAPTPAPTRSTPVT